jgi:uncharacterized membrane protein YfcA
MSPAWLLDPRNALLAVLSIVALLYLALIVRATTRGIRAGDPALPEAGRLATGFITNFFDTLGIGSFATTTTIFRLKLTPEQRRWWGLVLGFVAAAAVVLLIILRPATLSGLGLWFILTICSVLVAGLLVLFYGGSVDDERIPGTLNVGHTLPTIAQAFIFTKIVPVDPKTLILLIIAAVLGAWVGAGVVARWPRRRIQIGMGVALLAAAGLLVLTLTNSNPTGGTLLELTGSKLAIGFAGNVLLGALMTLGIGLYAPCMIMIYLLGMDPKAAFPIMMGSCAFLMPVASARFVRERSFDLRASLGLLLGGIPAVLIAAYIVKSLPLTVVRWLVLVVVVYTAVGLLLTARREAAGLASPAPSGATPGAAVP